MRPANLHDPRLGVGTEWNKKLVFLAPPSTTMPSIVKIPRQPSLLRSEFLFSQPLSINGSDRALFSSRFICHMQREDSVKINLRHLSSLNFRAETSTI